MEKSNLLINFASELAILEGLSRMKEIESSINISPSCISSGYQSSQIYSKRNSLCYSPKKKLIIRKKYSIVPVNPLFLDEFNYIPSKVNPNSYYNTQTNFIYRKPEDVKNASNVMITMKYSNKAENRKIGNKLICSKTLSDVSSSLLADLWRPLKRSKSQLN